MYVVVRGSAQAASGGSAPGEVKMAANNSDGLVLRLQRFLPFPRPVVYRALSDPYELGKWWGPQGFSAPCVDFDPLVGGSYRIAMQPPDGDLFYLSGEFREVHPPARLAYTFRWSPPDPDDRETLVSLFLLERNGGTELVLIHAGFATERRRALHEAGWADSLERLAQTLAATVP
jgi:uncharacterized protein YndB with AHSA1/START domain